MYILAESAEELEARLEITAKEAENTAVLGALVSSTQAGASALSLDTDLSFTCPVPTLQKLALTPVGLKN